MINIQILANDTGLVFLAIEINKNRKLLLKPGYLDEDSLHPSISGLAAESLIKIWFGKPMFCDQSEDFLSKEI